MRWWWSGDKIEKSELARELRLLKQAGIGGVEINPIKFPARTSDMGKPALQWLSPEWIDMLKFAFDEAKSLEMTCDLSIPALLRGILQYRTQAPRIQQIQIIFL